MNKALFLDRDGTINVNTGYVHKPEDFIFIDGIVEAIRKYNQEKYIILVVSNQSGVARGFFTEEDVLSLHQYADELLNEKGVHINKWYYCPHHPIHGIGKYKVDCNCRKPKTGMIEKAILEFDIDVSQSLFVGDKSWDINCGEKMGIRSIYINEFLNTISDV